MYKFLLVVLEKGAVPFCHYSNPDYNSLANPSFMPLGTLKSVVDYAKEKGLYLNFLYGKHQPPDDYERVIASVTHVKMIPPGLQNVYEDGVLVLEADEHASFGLLQPSQERNMILRVGRNQLARLAEILDLLQGKYRRLNLHLIDIEDFGEKDYNIYERQIGKIGRSLYEHYKAGEEIEINILSDRMLLSQMNNCEAGLKHLTVAPNGKMYICPGFYHDDEASAAGAFTDEQEMAVKNRQLLDINHAPICSRCDAYHCKRCVYLNKKSTLEINTPSQQQCLISHIERESSARLLRALQTTKPFDKISPIPSLSHSDPFSLVVGAKWGQENKDADTYGVLDSEDYLAQIFEMQRKIMRKLDA